MGAALPENDEPRITANLRGSSFARRRIVAQVAGVTAVKPNSIRTGGVRAALLSEKYGRARRPGPPGRGSRTIELYRRSCEDGECRRGAKEAPGPPRGGLVGARGVGGPARAGGRPAGASGTKGASVARSWLHPGIDSCDGRADESVRPARSPGGSLLMTSRHRPGPSNLRLVLATRDRAGRADRDPAWYPPRRGRLRRSVTFSRRTPVRHRPGRGAPAVIPERR